MISTTGNAFANEGCIRHEEMTAVKAAAVQQQLMVAALSCRATSLYNRFVLSYRPELQASDEALKAFFQRRTGGEAEYNAFKTRLANASSLSSIGHGRAYCADAYAAFDSAFSYDRRSLEEFVSAQPISLDLSYSECDQPPRLLARNERHKDWRSRRAAWIERRRAVPAEMEDDGPVLPRDHELAPEAPAY
jgi:hypothetical protein